MMGPDDLAGLEGGFWSLGDCQASDGRIATCRRSVASARILSSDLTDGDGERKHQQRIL